MHQRVGPQTSKYLLCILLKKTNNDKGRQVTLSIYVFDPRWIIREGKKVGSLWIIRKRYKGRFPLDH